MIKALFIDREKITKCEKLLWAASNASSSSLSLSPPVFMFVHSSFTRPSKRQTFLFVPIRKTE